MPRDPSGTYSTPVGTDGVPNFPIESSKYNIFVHDVETDLNGARPIVSGGTGSINADEALFNLKAEKSTAVISNYDLDLFQPGSFYSVAGATNAPVAGHAFVGICYSSDPPAYPPSNVNLVIEARDQDEPIVAGVASKIYVREKRANVWGGWSSDTQSIFDLANTKVAKAGDTMTGSLILSYPSAQYLVTDSNAGGKTMITGWGAGTGTPNLYGFYAAPFGTLAYINANTGQFNIGGAIASSGIVSGTSFQAGPGTTVGPNFIELGIPGTAGTPYIDFHSSGSGSDYDSRIIASAGGAIGTGGLSVVAATTTFSGTISAGSSLTANPQYLNGTNVAVTDGTNYILRSSSAIYMQHSAGATWGYFSAAGLVMSIGNFSTPGAITAGSSIVAGGLMQTNWQGLTAVGSINSNPYQVNLVAGNPSFGDMGIALLHFPGVWAGVRITVQSGVAFEFRQDGSAWKAGGGSWSNNSDARIKTIVANYSTGLDTVAALHPVRYKYKGNDTYEPPSDRPTGVDPERQNRGAPTVPYPNSPNYAAAMAGTEFIGLIAQEVDALMPEMVSKTPGHIDGVAVTDLHNLDTSPLIFALINAIKELKVRVEQLETP